MNWMHIVGVLLLLVGFFTASDNLLGAICWIIIGAVFVQLGINKSAEEKNEREAESRTYTNTANTSYSNSKRPVHTTPAESNPAPVTTSTPTAQNAYIFNIDYINTCKSSFIAFDVETTGLSPSTDRIIELSAIRFSNYSPCETFSTLINPQRHIPSSASSVNHIYDEDVINAPIESEAIRGFCDFVGKETLQGSVVLVAHNALFDIKFLLHAFSRAGIEANLQFQDTLYMCRNFSLELSNYKLQTVAAYYGIVQANAHRALDDARTCGEIFVKLLETKYNQHTEKHGSLTHEELELCVWLKGIIVEEDLNTQLLTFSSKTYLQIKCLREVARFKTKAKRPYALIPKDLIIPVGIEAVAPSKTESEKYLRVYYTSPTDLTPLKKHYIEAYKKAFSQAESYISDSIERMRTVAKQIDGDICI